MFFSSFLCLPRLSASACFSLSLQFTLAFSEKNNTDWSSFASLIQVIALDRQHKVAAVQSKNRLIAIVPRSTMSMIPNVSIDWVSSTRIYLFPPFSILSSTHRTFLVRKKTTSPVMKVGHLSKHTVHDPRETLSYSSYTPSSTPFIWFFLTPGHWESVFIQPSSIAARRKKNRGTNLTSFFLSSF